MDLNFYLNSKWVSTVASIWIQCTSGSLYTFSIYSQTLKSTQHYDQSTLDIVSVSKDIGANIGVLSGLLYDFIASRTTTTTTTGPWLVHFLGRPNASWAISSCGPPSPASFRRCRCPSCACSCSWRLMLRATLTLPMLSPEYIISPTTVELSSAS